MDDLSTTRPEVKCGHLLAETHMIVHDLHHKWVAVLVMVLAVWDAHRHSHDTTFGLLLFAQGSDQCVVCAHALLVRSRVDLRCTFLELFGLINVHDIEKRT